MIPAFLLDTSYLISLVDSTRKHHGVARQYYQHCLQVRAPLHVSTLSLAEFATKQPITDLPLKSLLVEPFNIRHASVSGELCAKLGLIREDGESRVAIRTDILLLAQATSEGIPLILTEDKKTLAKYADRAREAGISQSRTVLLEDGFDNAWFNDGQRLLELPGQLAPPP